jgi:hypothetical protein
MRNVIFVRNGVKKTIAIAPTHSSGGIKNTIKATFGLPQSCQPALENMNTRVILGDIQTADLLSDPDTNPKYRVFISEDQQLKINGDHCWWRQFILSFFSN